MSETRQRNSAVVDLNLFVSGLISKLGQPQRLLQHLRDDRFVLVFSQDLRSQIGEVTERAKFRSRFGLTPSVRADFLELIDRKAVFVTPTRTLPLAVRDPKDEIVLATALGGSADYL